jgi:Ca2+-binding RTX toxin-like protein
MSTTPSTFITGLYTNVLRRSVAAGTATNAELLSWDALVTANVLTQAQVTSAIVNSVEATTVVAPIVRIYQTFFNRVPDAAGLTFWVGQSRSGTSLAAISNAFSTAAEFTAAYGTPSASTIDSFLSALYTNVLGRTADATGFAFWKAQFAAQGSNAAAAAAIANSFSASAEFVSASATNITNLLTTAASSGSLGSGPLGGSSGSASGETFTLTSSTDTLTGTSGNDTFIATAATTGPTFQVADTLNGGSGTDVLNLTIDVLGADSVPAATTTSIETINVRNVSGQNQTISGSNYVGHTTLNNNLSTNLVAFTNVASGAAISVTGNGTVTNAATTAAYVAGATAAALTITGGVTAGAITITGTGIVATTINSSGATANVVGAITDANTSKALTINAAANLTATSIATGTASSSMTISGAAASVSIGTLDTDYTTVNAGGLTVGGLTATMSTTATTTLTGGAGNDVITTGVTLTTGSVAAGTGTDRLIVADTTHLNTVALGAKYTGFEVLQVQDKVSTDLDQISGITAIRINDGNDAAGTGVTNLSAAQAAAITVIAANATGAITIGVKNATTVGNIDTVALLIDDGATAVNTLALGTPVIAGVEKLTLALTDNVTIADLTSASALDSITLTGAGTANITTAALATANFSVNGSAMTGALTVSATNFATNGVALTGGSAADSLTGGAQNDTINGGAGNDTLLSGLAGNDTINGGDGNDTIVSGTGNDSLTGGAGSDTFRYNGTVNAVYTDSLATTAGLDRITDFVAGTDKIGLVNTGTTVTSVTLTSVAVATAADVGTLLTAIGNSVAASTAAAAQVGVITVAAGAMAGTYLFVNDLNNAAQAADTLINITGVSGTITTGDFVFA